VLDTINRLGIKRFVEIGIYKGGLAALLVHTTKHIPGFEYLGIEIDSQIVEPTVRKLFDPPSVNG
jgi:tRNA G46 methylase TrmB